MEYGYINEVGNLVSKEVDENHIKYLDLTLWKPIDSIDPEKIKSDDIDYYIKITPFDNGDRITYQYNKVFDKQKLKGEIHTKKESLTESDYKIIKCYEASLINEKLPYNIEELHAERQRLRDEINQLETTIANA